MSGYHVFKDETIMGLADEARRLGKIEGTLSPAQMKEIFTGVVPFEIVTSVGQRIYDDNALAEVPLGSFEIVTSVVAELIEE